MTQYSQFVCLQCHDWKTPHEHAVICTECVYYFRQAIRRLRNQRDNHRKAKSRWKRQTESLQRAIASLHKSHDHWQAEHGGMQNTINALNRECRELREQNKHCKEGLSDLTTQIHELQTEVRQEQHEKQQLYEILHEQGWTPSDLFRALQAQANRERREDR